MRSRSPSPCARAMSTSSLASQVNPSPNHNYKSYMDRSKYSLQMARGAPLVGSMSTASPMVIAHCSDAESATPVSVGFDKVRF